MSNDNHRYNTRSKTKKDNLCATIDNSSSEESSDTDDEQFDINEYRKLLATLFPSKYAKQRALKSLDTCNHKRKKGSSDVSNSSQENTIIEPKRSKKDCSDETLHCDSEDDYEDEYDSDYEDDSEDEDEYEDEDVPTTFKINFVYKMTDSESTIEDDKDHEEHEEHEEHEDSVSRKKKIKKNTAKFNALLREKNFMSDATYFNNNLTLEQQDKLLENMEQVVNMYRIDKPYRIQLLDSDIPLEYKAIAFKKLNNFKGIEPGQGEYYKAKNWITTFMSIPFGKYKHFNVNLKENTREECADFIHNAKKILDKAVYGMNDVKMQIMQLVGMWVTNPDAMGTSIAIKGPMGTGKTTLVKEGISKILGRDFAFMALGGATDSSFLEGHSYTYEGAMWGKIVDSLIQCKSMNPIFFFDELDKVSDTPKGEEIIGILTHLTDTTQNSKFHDKYFSELEFDLSRCLFIFSYNDESKVNPILLDRMYKVQTSGYNVNEKIIIANEYILPKICQQVSFKIGDIIIDADILRYIINTYCDKEQGVREIKRSLEIIYTKLNLYRLLQPDSTLVSEQSFMLNLQFPLTLTKEIVDAIIHKKPTTGSWSNMYI